jgi:hypothetical protein
MAMIIDSRFPPLPQRQRRGKDGAPNLIDNKMAPNFIDKKLAPRKEICRPPRK